MTNLVLPRARDSGAWWLLALGGIAIVGPSYWHAANGLWQTDEFGHGPIVLAVAAWLFWNAREGLASAPTAPRRGWGWTVFLLGLGLYVFGRVFTVSSVEFVSHVVILTGGLLLLKGGVAVRAVWFPLLYLLFLAPLPGSAVDALTGPLKQWISTIVVELLYAVGYPIARTGVMITIGPYQLLVADACSGLHSMFSLLALGTLFMYMTARPGRLHNALMLLSILPIAFLANIVRVVVLVLVTYHWGDEAGQGFLHGAAGIVLMLAALVTLFAVDAVLSMALGGRRKAPAV